MKDGLLVKGIKFKDHKYIGDPINAVRIFNNKEVDEIIFLDIGASINNTIPKFKLIEDIADECYVPFTVGGGIKSLVHIQKILYSGAEKICLNTAAIEKNSIIKEASKHFGSQAIIVCIDIKKDCKGEYVIYSHCGTRRVDNRLIDYIRLIEDMGAGEIMINSIHKDGTKEGFDIELLGVLSNMVEIPIIGLAGASKIGDFEIAVRKTNVSALSAGSFFVFHGRRDAVLIQYPSKEKLKNVYNESPK
jgi:cyclase